VRPVAPEPGARGGRFGWLRRHCAVLRQTVRIGVIRKAQFRVEFANQVLMDVVYYGMHVAFFEFLYAHASSIAGWSRDEMRVFLGMYFVSDGFLMTWLGQSWHFAEDVKNGNLDPLRVRPGSPIVLYFFQRFSLEGCTNLALAFGWLAWSLARVGFEPDLAGLALLALAIAIAWWSRTLLVVLFSTVEFQFVGSGLAKLLEYFAYSFGERPLDVFTRRLRWMFLHAIPVAALAWLPASIVLRRLAPLAATLDVLVLVALGVAVSRLWRAGFRRYESALG
jgi:ABC-2 type transport system permease protein